MKKIMGIGVLAIALIFTTTLVSAGEESLYEQKKQRLHAERGHFKKSAEQQAKKEAYAILKAGGASFCLFGGLALFSYLTKLDRC